MHFYIFLLFPLTLVESSRITERFETALNKLTNTGGPIKGKIKRYRCIEEYVSLDEQGNAIEGSSEVGREFTTTAPPVEERKRPKMHGVKNIKTSEYAISPYKMKMYPNGKTKKRKSLKRRKTTTTTTTTTTMEPTTTTEPLKDPDTLIEELYLKPQETIPAPMENVREPERNKVNEPPLVRKTISIADIDRSEARYSPNRWQKNTENDIEYDEYDDEFAYDLYPSRRRGGRRRYRPRWQGSLGARKQPFAHEGIRNSNIDTYYPETYGDDLSSPPRQYNRRVVIPRIALPIVTDQSLRSYIHHTQPQVVLPVPAVVVSTTTTTVPTIPTFTLATMELANEDSCAKVLSYSRMVGVDDVWTWSKLPGSCQFIQTMIGNIDKRQNFTCEQIWHFLESCKKNHFL